MKYTKNSIISRLDDLVYADKRQTNRFVCLLRSILLFICFFTIVCGGALGTGMFLGIIRNAPSVDSLNFSPVGYASKTYDITGNLTATLVKEGSNREEASYEEIPKDLINAFVAIEDQRFWEHSGIDPKSITRAVKGILTDDSSAGGGSTITQQLIKNNVFKGGMEKGFALYERKFQEWYIALMLENQPDIPKEKIKKSILKDYLNTINLGNNTLGVKVAAERYFGKELSKLSLDECTVLASITKNPSRLNPITHPEENQERRLQVLKNMLQLGYISEQQYKAARGTGVYSRISNHNIETKESNSSIYSYFTDELIRQCTEAFIAELGMTESEASDLLYSGGLKIMTTQDPAMQAIVDEEVNDPENYDTAKYSVEWRCSVKHKDGSMTNYGESNLTAFMKEKKRSFDGLYKTQEEAQEAVEGYKLSFMGDGDEITAETCEITLQPQVSFVLMDQKTKEVKAISGGRGEKKYSLTLNRATDTKRQPGSTFKVISSFAPALEEKGATLASSYYDSEYTLGSKTFRNWWNREQFFGYSNIRDGIEFSMNIVAVRCLMETVSPETGLAFARRLGISTLMDEDCNGALALGGLTRGVTNLDLTNGFASIADGGLYGKPLFFTKVYNRNGTLLLDMTGREPSRVMKDTTAFLLTDAMKNSTIGHTKWSGGFTVNNTSSRARLEKMETAGKSGTTTNNVDIWFVGFTPYYTAGVWAGCDENQSLYDSSDGTYNGGTSFHKDIWRKIMTRVHEGLENKSFEMPDDIVQAAVCRKSGCLPSAGCELDIRTGTSAVYTEYFERGSVPTQTCTLHGENGSLLLPAGEELKPTDDLNENNLKAAALLSEGTEGELSDGPGSIDDVGSGTTDNPSIYIDPKFLRKKIGPS